MHVYSSCTLAYLSVRLCHAPNYASHNVANTAFGRSSNYLFTTHAVLCFVHAACHQLGEYYEGVEKNATRAADIYEETCYKHGYAESCLSLGNIYITGNGNICRSMSCVYDHSQL